jgi:hypothetical protein
MSWQPIETAPKDGTCVDLWMIDQDGRRWRETDAFFVTDRSYFLHEWLPATDGSRWGKFKTLPAIKRDGWWAPNHDYDGESGWCDEPKWFNAHPQQNKWQFKTPTHWISLPEPPS